MILDSNIIIYSAIPENENLRDFISVNSPFASEVSRVEVLGYHKLTAQQKEFFESLFESTSMLPISDEVLVKAIEMRQSKKMSLGDSIIAATALVNNLRLITANTKDFKWIAELTLVNPLEN